MYTNPLSGRITRWNHITINNSAKKRDICAVWTFRNMRLKKSKTRLERGEPARTMKASERPTVFRQDKAVEWSDTFSFFLRTNVRGYGASQTKGFRPLLDIFIPSIYQIFRASQNANRWRIINKCLLSLGQSQRVKNIVLEASEVASSG